MLGSVVTLSVVGISVVLVLHVTHPDSVEPLFALLKVHTGIDAAQVLQGLLAVPASPPTPAVEAAVFVKKPKKVKAKKPSKAPAKAANKPVVHATHCDDAETPVETRVDPADGKRYPYTSFQEEYGADAPRCWAAAAETQNKASDAGADEQARRQEPDASSEWTIVSASERSARTNNPHDGSWWDDEGDEEEDAQEYGIPLQPEGEEIGVPMVAGETWETVASKKTRGGRSSSPVSSVWSDESCSSASSGEGDGLTKKQRCACQCWLRPVLLISFQRPWLVESTHYAFRGLPCCVRHRENRRKAEKKKALKAAADATRKGLNEKTALKANRTFSQATRVLGNA